MSNVGIYKITSPTGKVYIGQSVNISNRMSHYRGLTKTIAKQRKLFASLSKYGIDSHSASVIHELPKDVGQEVLNTYETLYMQLYRDCGVELLNLKEGGLNGRHSEETKMKQRLNGKLGKPVSEETRAKMSMNAKGKPSPMKGKKHTEETLVKLRAYQSNRPFTPKGHPISEEHKIKMQEARKSVPHPMLGKHHSEESKEKNRQSKLGKLSGASKKIICQKTGVVFNSIKDAAESIFMQPNTLRMQLRGNNTNRTTFIYLTNKI